MTTQPNPEEVRRRTRLKSYRNELQERDAVAAVDKVVFAHTLQHEIQLNQRAHAFRERARLVEARASHVVTALRAEVIDALRSDALAHQSIAIRWRELYREAEAVRSLLRAACEEADWLKTKLDDPHGDLVRLWDRWPVIRPVVQP